MRARQAGIAIAVLLGAIAACRQLVGIGDQPPMDDADAGPACGIAYAGASCEACLAAKCCTQAKNCAAGGGGCGAIEQCLGKCDPAGDPTCRATCTSGAGADPLEGEFAACMARSCAQPCSLTCGGFAEIFGPDAAAGCQSCIQDAPQGVCTTAAQCAGDPDCQAALRCPQIGPFQDKFQACVNATPSGSDVVTLLNEVQSSCLNACALGSQWSCLGHIPPVMASNSANAAFSFRDFVSGMPTTGMLVQVCAPTTAPCTQQSSGVTDDAGAVSLTIPGSVAAPTGYLRMTGGVEPMLFYWGFPTSQPSWQLGFYSVTMSGVAALASALQVTLIQGRAVVGVEANDCWGTYFGAPGVEFVITPHDSNTAYFYQQSDGTWSRSAGRTSALGNAIIVNVPVVPSPVGTVQLTATPLSVGKASTRVSAYVQPDMITGILASPNQ